jgi:hypothetical protein
VSAENTEAQVIAEFAKSTREVVRVQHSTYKGRSFVDCRTWFHDAAGELRATPKGLTLTVDVVPQLIDALQQAYDQATGTPTPVG